MFRGSRFDLWKINGRSVCRDEAYHTGAARTSLSIQVATIHVETLVISSPESDKMTKKM